jgi:hypothetical protein
MSRAIIVDMVDLKKFNLSLSAALATTSSVSLQYFHSKAEVCSTSSEAIGKATLNCIADRFSPRISL